MIKNMTFLDKYWFFWLAQHQIIQHRKSPGWRRFGAGHTYLVRDDSCGSPLSAIPMAIGILTNIPAKVNKKGKRNRPRMVLRRLSLVTRRSKAYLAIWGQQKRDSWLETDLRDKKNNNSDYACASKLHNLLIYLTLGAIHLHFTSKLKFNSNPRSFRRCFSPWKYQLLRRIL